MVGVFHEVKIFCSESDETKILSTNNNKCICMHDAAGMKI